MDLEAGSRLHALAPTLCHSPQTARRITLDFGGLLLGFAFLGGEKAAAALAISVTSASR